MEFSGRFHWSFRFIKYIIIHCGCIQENAVKLKQTLIPIDDKLVVTASYAAVSNIYHGIILIKTVRTELIKH